jgi:hypothetical protein
MGSISSSSFSGYLIRFPSKNGQSMGIEGFLFYIVGAMAI